MGVPDLPQWLALLHAPGLWLPKLVVLLRTVKDPAIIFKMDVQEWRRHGLSDALCHYLKNPDWVAVKRDMAWLEKPGHTALTWQDPRYPALLREIALPPPLLFVKGDPAVLTMPQLAIVGSRNPSHTGIELAKQFAHALTTSGLTITSGLALGIDAASHQGALAANGKTVAVVGTGLDIVYPTRHCALAEMIAANGALVSEFPLGMSAKPENFPRRNRLISGLSMGVLVVEAALRSGSLITAHAACEQGRDVFAIPGSLRNPLARGCHELIRQGAKLVETADDILQELGVMARFVQETAAKRAIPTLDKDHTKLVECLGHDEVVPIDLLVVRSGFAVSRVSSMLTQLELQGYVVAVVGGYALNK